MTAAPKAGWQPVRIPHPDSLGRSRGFPPEAIDRAAMSAWCEQSCRGGWATEEMDDGGLVYLFEDNAEAMEFALRWFPFKCT